MKKSDIKVMPRPRKAAPKAAYDVTRSSGGASGSGNKRRQANIETGEEHGIAGIMRPLDKLLGLNLLRDAERNYSPMRSMMLQLKNNVVGSLGKIQINTGDDFGKEATDWFNQDWFKNCDFKGTLDFSRISRNVLCAKKREGDFLTVFDDGSILNVKEGGTGKIFFYEADQIAETDKELPSTTVQDSGILRDQYGREIGYSVTTKRGLTRIPADKTTIYTRDPDNEDVNSVKLIKSTFRLNQGRGIGDMLTSIADMIDCYEMRSKELQSAKVAASLSGTIERSEAVENFDDDRLDPNNPTPKDDTVDATTLPEKQTEPANYERLESLTGGYMDYLAPGDKFTLHDPKRPNIEMAPFLDHVTDSAGSVLGFAHAYSRMKADGSYTAFRGDMVMTWVTFYVEQKDLEREWFDWIGARAVRWGIKQGKIKAKPTPGWEKKMSWHLPSMPYVNELEERQANLAALKNGEKDLSDLLGPNWKDKLKALAEQLNLARELLLPLAVFEQKSGGEAPTGDKSKKDNSNDPNKKGTST